MCEKWNSQTSSSSRLVPTWAYSRSAAELKQSSLLNIRHENIIASSSTVRNHGLHIRTVTSTTLLETNKISNQLYRTGKGQTMKVRIKLHGAIAKAKIVTLRWRRTNTAAPNKYRRYKIEILVYVRVMTFLMEVKRGRLSVSCSLNGIRLLILRSVWKFTPTIGDVEINFPFKNCLGNGSWVIEARRLI